MEFWLSVDYNTYWPYPTMDQIRMTRIYKSTYQVTLMKEIAINKVDSMH